MNPLARSIAVTLWSLAFANAIAEAEALDAIKLNVHPVLPTPSSQVVIEGRTAKPFNPSEHCIALYRFHGMGPPDWRLIPSDQIEMALTNHFRVNLGALFEGYYEFMVSNDACRPKDQGTEFDLDLYFSVVSTNGPVTVVEYFDAALGHYFITADAHEIAVLDSGQISGWVRTGETFHALPVDTMPSTAAPVCRYYGLPSAGLDTHFFTDNAAECAAVPALWPNMWVLETNRAFGVEQDWSDDDPYCDASHQPLYRLYNQRADANHRYTTSTRIRDEMIAKGWVSEGRYLGPEGTFSMCVLP
jgi:hypothetical protein